MNNLSIIESEAVGQNILVNVRHVITVLRIQTVDQDERAEKQRRSVDPCESHPYESRKNPGSGSFEGVKVNLREDGIVI